MKLAGQADLLVRRVLRALFDGDRLGGWISGAAGRAERGVGSAGNIRQWSLGPDQRLENPSPAPYKVPLLLRGLGGSPIL